MARASRVEEQEFEFAACPVCRQKIVGTVTVEIHMKPLTMDLKVDEGSNTVSPKVRVDATARLRSMNVQHRCSPTWREAAILEEAPGILADGVVPEVPRARGGRAIPDAPQA